MKKHLAIICGIFYPEPSATGMCAKRFANLLSDGYEIDIICLSENEEQTTVDFANGMKVHKLAGRRMSAESRSHGIMKKAIHLLGGVQIKTQLLGNLTWYRKAAYQKLEELHSVHGLDVVFSICSPLAAHYAAGDFKRSHPSVHWCGYTVDPYAARNRIRPVWCSYKQMIEAERKVLLSMDSVLLSEEVFKRRPELYRGCKCCQELPYILPELQSDTEKRCFFDDKDINCVYAGSFYRDIRNPECMLDLFSHLNEPRIKLHLFSRGCEELVRKYADGASSIIVHEQVSTSEMAQVYQDADILVNIGNATPEFMPSKTFEYIATGKPIINFYYEKCVNEVLARYPLCLQLQNASVDGRTQILREFALKNGRKRVEESEIRKLYYNNSSDYVSEILYDAVRG